MSADQLRNLLKMLKWGQRQAARELGIDERSMRYYCSGHIKPPLYVIITLGALITHESDKRLIDQLTHERDGWKERALLAEEDDRGVL